MTDQIRITHDQTRRLAELIHSLRGDWDIRGILSALYDAGGKGGNFDLAQAAIRAASTPTNLTPAVIALDGPHWRLEQAMPGAKKPQTGPRNPPMCHTCYEPHERGEKCGPLRGRDTSGPTGEYLEARGKTKDGAS